MTPPIRKWIYIDDTSSLEDVELVIANTCELIDDVSASDIGLGNVDEYKSTIDELISLKARRYNLRRIKA